MTKNMATKENTSETMQNGVHQNASSPSPVYGPTHVSFATRRKSAQLLAPLILSKNFQAPKCTPEDVHLAQAVGSDAYGDFLRHRLEKEKLPEPEELSVVVEYHKNAATTALRSTHLSPEESFEASPVETPVGGKYPQWGKAGRELDKLASSFEQTEERKRVRQKAEQIADEDEITKEKFLELLSELFSKGRITSHRIVVLFVFCSDVVICALRKKGDKLFCNFLHWVFDFITEKVCAWVAENGGWEAVLSNTGAWLVAGVKLVAAGFLIYLGYRLAKNAVDNFSK